MKQLTSRLPFLTFTHSMWRGDFSRRVLAQSWAEADAIPRTVPRTYVMNIFIGFEQYSAAFVFDKEPRQRRGTFQGKGKASGRVQGGSGEKFGFVFGSSGFSPLRVRKG